MAGLLSVRDARQRILAPFVTVGHTIVPLSRALNRVLCENISAPMELPPFANSSMDGFAVRSVDISEANHDKPVRLQVVVDIPAGLPASISIDAGEAARIMTGAPLPDGADAVIPIEDTNYNQDRPIEDDLGEVLIYQSVRSGSYIRPKGHDIRLGEPILSTGRRLKPQDLGVLAMLGFSSVPVYRVPRIALLSTGDELVLPGEPLMPGKIHDSNSFMLSALIESAGCDVIHLGIARDDIDSVRQHLDAAVDQDVDLILSSAGVSVGAYDHVRNVVESSGSLDFWRVNIRPGKPIAFGQYRQKPIIGLPGNPVSAYVTFEVFVRLVLSRLSGMVIVPRPTRRVRLVEEVESDGRESYLRGCVEFRDGQWVAKLAGDQGSGNLLSIVRANALLIIPSGVKSLPADSEVEAWLLD